LLNDANENESIALLKQQQALLTYKKFEKSGVSFTKNNANKSNNLAANKTATVNQIQQNNALNKATNNESLTPSNNKSDNSSTKSNFKRDTINYIIASNTETDSINSKTKNINEENKINFKRDTIKYIVAANLSEDTISANSTIDKQKVSNSTETTLNLPNSTSAATIETAANKQIENSPVSTTSAANNEAIKSFQLTEKEKFEQRSRPIYSLQKPIPVNEKLPEGLVFKVQIGAFQNPIPQDLFRGITPITGETTAQGYTRYTAGLFVKFATADLVKNEIQNLGYRDAFVVAFLNGVRIPISQALAMTGERAATVATSNTITVQQNEQRNIATNSNNTLRENIPQTNNGQTIQPTVNTNAQAAIQSQDVNTLGGLFYTVQVGVYSQAVSNDKLFNIQPLYSESLPNGLIRYNSGIFNNVARANEAKGLAVDAGIRDAFVVAYYQGKRVSLGEARILETQGTEVFSKAPNINQLPRFGSAINQTATNRTIVPVENITPNVNEKPTNATQLTNVNSPNTSQGANLIASNTIPKGIIFRVQIGAFREQVPIEIANKFIAIASKGVNNYTDESGLTIYAVGNFTNYEDAAKVKVELANSNIPDAFVVAYNNGIKISVEEARRLIGN
jgi:hypothetical protein